MAAAKRSAEQVRQRKKKLPTEWVISKMRIGVHESENVNEFRVLDHEGLAAYRKAHKARAARRLAYERSNSQSGDAHPVETGEGGDEGLEEDLIEEGELWLSEDKLRTYRYAVYYISLAPLYLLTLYLLPACHQ